MYRKKTLFSKSTDFYYLNIIVYFQEVKESWISPNKPLVSRNSDSIRFTTLYKPCILYLYTDN